MRVIVLLFVLGVASPAWAVSHLLAWEGRNLTTADTSFRIERCLNLGRWGCAMRFVTNVPRSTTQYLDQGTYGSLPYCYRVKATTSPYSNIACTP